MKSISRYIALIVSFLVIGALFYFFSNIVAYVLIAWILSMIGQPFMRFFQKHLKIGKFKAGSNTAAILTLICYFILVTLLIWMFVPLVINQANNLAEVNYSEIAGALKAPAQQLQDWLSSYGLIEPETHFSVEQQLHKTFSEWFEPARIGNFFSSLVAAAGNIFITLFSIVFITFFFLKEQGLFVNILVALMPLRYEKQVRRAIEDISSLLTRYFGGIVIQITIITLFVSISLSLFGIKNALLIGFFAALINVIPYLGPIIGATFGVIITISSNLNLEFYSQMLPLILKVVVVFAGMQLLDNFVLQPWIFSHSVLAHPLEIFIVILMGAKTNGIVGMVLAIPAYTVLRVIARGFLSEFKIVQKITGGMKDV